MDTIPAIEDTSPVQLPSPAGEHGEGLRLSIRDQLESARMPVDADGRLIPPPPIPKALEEEEVNENNRGSLAPQAASILMKLLYAARICRFDLLRSINNLARKITKWTKKEDALLHHLMAYVHSKHHMMIGWVGDSLGDSSIGLFADADYAGCGESLKSTSGAHMHIQGPHTRFPLAGLSKRQGCLSHSTPEAEIVAADFAMTRLGLPAIALWQQLGGTDPNFVFYDDNQTMIGVIRTGKNPTMRHLERTHGISIGWMHSIFQEGYVSLAYEVTAKMAADIHTKSFKDSVSWTHACQLINIFPPALIGSQEIMDLMRPTHAQSADEKGHQHYSFKGEVPCFPYTEAPILPQVLYRAGLSSKEGLQEHDSVDPILVVKFPRMLRGPPSALPPGRYLRSTWILREGQWHRMEDHAHVHDAPAKFDRYVERAVFQFHPVRGQLRAAAVSEVHLSPVPEHPPLGQCFARALPAKWRSVVAALARAIHGGYQGFTLPLRFNGRLYLRRVPYVGNTKWTTIIEDVWEHMAMKKREMKGHGEPIVPRVVEFQENNGAGLIIQFYDYDGGLVHTYKDPSSDFKLRVTIKDAPKKTTVWTVIGVDADNWWNDYAPGMDCMKEFAPGPHYDPSAQINVLCTGNQVDDAMCSYLYDVMTSRQQNANAVIFVGAGVLGGSSWLNRQVNENFEKVEFRTDYPWGEVVQRNCAQSSSKGNTSCRGSTARSSSPSNQAVQDAVGG